MSTKNFKLQFKIECNETKFGEEVYIIGNSDEIGKWNQTNINESQKLKCNHFPTWESNILEFSNLISPLEYKYIIKSSSNITWENKFEGNRILDLTNKENGFYLIDDGKFNTKSKQTINSLSELSNKEENLNELPKIDDKDDEKEINQIQNNKDNNSKSKESNLSQSVRKGLTNIGATCYMNATLQCFCHIKKFVDFFQNNPQINNNGKETLSYSFKLLIDKMTSNDNNNSYSPKEFKEKISKMNSLFKGVNANDSKDLVNFIIMQLHEELNRVKNNTIVNSNTIIDQTNQQLVFNNFVINFKVNNQSIISDLFYAMNSTISQCGICRINVYNYQIYFFLIFPLEEVRKYKNQCNIKKYYNFNYNNFLYNNEVSLEDCFEYDKKVNFMTGQNRMYCNICKINTDSTSYTNLVTGPEVLILLLNRGKGIEFNVKINFKEYLNLSNYIIYNNTGCRYKLIGVITHIGESGMGGHFIAFCYDYNSDKWIKYNDEIISDVNNFQSEVIDFGNPYLLFYEKC